MRGVIQKDDYVGFTYAGIHSSQFGIKSVTNGDRYQRYLSPEFQDLTQSTIGRDGTLYFGNNKNKNTFTFNIAFDDMTEEDYRGLRRWLNSGISEFILDETPYIKYYAKPGAPVQISFLVFLDDYGERVYKGEFQVGFVCYDSFGYSVHKWLEDYSMTGFGAGDILELDQISSSVKEWAASSRLLPAQTYYDITYDVYNKDENCFYLYNPGDLACDFTLEFKANQSNLVLNLFEWDEDSGAPSTQASYSQTLTNIPADSGKVVIDTYKRLIYIEHIDGSKEPINDCWTAGNFFQIPTNQDLGQYSILQVSFTGGTKGDNVKITYDYKYL